MVFAIHWHESAMDLHVFPISIPPPTSLSIPSLWVFPVCQPWQNRKRDTDVQNRLLVSVGEGECGIFWDKYTIKGITDPLAFSIEHTSCAFLFWFTFSASMILLETVTYCCLEGVTLCGSISILTVCPIPLVEELVWCRLHIFLQCLMEAFSFLGDGTGDGLARAGASFLGKTSPLVSGHHHPIRDEVCCHIAGGEVLSIRPKLVLFL